MSRNRHRQALLNEVERVLRAIRYPVDLPDFFHAQCHHALLAAGYNVSREVLMTDARRIDLVVVDRRAVVAIELERDEVPERTTCKFRDLPDGVLRMVVLRQRPVPLQKSQFCDRVVSLRADLRPVDWLVTGSAILDEAPVTPLPHTALVLARAHESAQARRTILHESRRRGPKAAEPSYRRARRTG